MPKDKRQEIPAVRTLQAFDPSSNTASRSSRSNNPAVQDTGGSSQNSHNSNDATVSTARLPLVQAAATISQNSHLTTSFSTAGSSKAAIDPKGRVATMGDVLSGTQSALAPIRAKYQELSDDKAKYEWYCEIMCSMLSAYGENQDVKSKVVQANPNAVSSQYDKWKARVAHPLSDTSVPSKHVSQFVRDLNLDAESLLVSYHALKYYGFANVTAASTSTARPSSHHRFGNPYLVQAIKERMGAHVGGSGGKGIAHPTELFVDHDKHWSTGGVIRALQVLKEDKKLWGKTVSRYRKK